MCVLLQNVTLWQEIKYVRRHEDDVSECREAGEKFPVTTDYFKGVKLYLKS